ncbi:hypothetical protein [Flammeovirga aprica]|uniref:Lipoprotein n=1 Tax=Flammeovirga aprica JL-4 TaxID=694437 RepID=A0A7X9P2X8_9BACT|nr:hypothetical protein [Flammeovirga aprica]NME68440.1 hypothetical protein [Flammeovirga aprica JL-4]
MQLKASIFVSFWLIISLGCQPKKTDQSEINKIMLNKAKTVLESENVKVIPNSQNSHYLCYTKSENPVKQKLSFIVLDEKQNISLPLKVIIDGDVSWIDDKHLKTSQSMGIAKKGESNIIHYSIDITTGKSTKL